MERQAGGSRLARFDAFYRDFYKPEHRHPLNVGLHVFGTLLANMMLVVVLLSPWPLPPAAVAWPVVHAAPGLIGHRLFERNAAVGDIRITRTDHPKFWFVLANHRLTWRQLTRLT